MSAIKKWIIAGVALILAGGLVFALGMSMLDWDFYELDTTQYEAKSYASEADDIISRVEIDVESFPIVVQSGEKVSLEYYDTDDSDVRVAVNSGVLSVYEDSHFNLFKRSMFQLKRIKLKYVLTIPDGTELSVSGANGNVKLNGVSAQSVRIDSTNADVVLADCVVNDLQIASTNADVVLRSCRGNTVVVGGTNLDLAMSDCNFASLQSKSTNGEVEMKSTVCPSVTLRAVNADFSLQTNQALIRRIETAYTQATSGTRTLGVNLTANYVLSRRMTLGMFFEHHVNTPIVSSNAYPVTDSAFGLSFNLNLSR